MGELHSTCSAPPWRKLCRGWRRFNAPPLPFASNLRTAPYEGCYHSQVSRDWLHGPYWLSSINVFDHTSY
jgi:hypothetical protein